jgi:hypothetical protein
VTAPRPAPEAELTERLAAVLRPHIPVGLLDGALSRHLAAVLAPMVARIADERAAEALEAARWAVHVERFNDDPDPDARWPRGAKQAVPTFYAGIVRAEAILRDRAAALRTAPDDRAAFGGETS